MRFEQVRVSDRLKFFEKDFKLKWNLKDYKNLNKPAVFLGLYTDKDIEDFKKHKSKSFVIFGGADLNPKTLNEIQKFFISKRSYTFGYPGEFSNTLESFNIPHKKFHLEVKNYSKFQPTPLGDKIYVYRGAKKKVNPTYYKWDEIVLPLVEEFGEERIIYTNLETIDDLIENYYKKSFVYVKPTPKGGCTTMFELGFMGRKTIGIGHENLGNFIKYKDVDNLITLIKEESKYIGQIRNEVSIQTKNCFIGPEWLNLKFWKNN